MPVQRPRAILVGLALLCLCANACDGESLPRPPLPPGRPQVDVGSRVLVPALPGSGAIALGSQDMLDVLAGTTTIIDPRTLFRFRPFLAHTAGSKLGVVVTAPGGSDTLLVLVCIAGIDSTRYVQRRLADSSGDLAVVPSIVFDGRSFKGVRASGPWLGATVHGTVVRAKSGCEVQVLWDTQLALDQTNETFRKIVGNIILSD